MQLSDTNVIWHVEAAGSAATVVIIVVVVIVIILLVAGGFYWKAKQPNEDKPEAPSSDAKPAAVPTTEMSEGIPTDRTNAGGAADIEVKADAQVKANAE